MKRKNLLWAMLLFAVGAPAQEHLEGSWYNDQFGVTISLELTKDGFRTKRSDRDDWYYYEKTGYNRFEDYAGNTIDLIDERTLEWQNNDRNRKLRFVKSGSSYRDDQYSSSRDDYRYLPQQSNRYRYEAVSSRALQGVWKNYFTGMKIRIKARRNNIEVKTNNRGPWVKYVPRSDGVFEDRAGNRYTYYRRSLTFESYSGDYIVRFRKY